MGRGGGGRRRGRPAPPASLLRTVEEARAGDADAVDALYRNHVGMVYGYLRACGAPDPEDLTAEVFVGMIRGLPSFDGGPSEFRAWLMTIAYRRLIDARRRQSRRPVDLHEPQTFDGVLSDTPPELAEVAIDPRLIAAFATLTEAQREVLALRFVADLGLKRVATITGRPVGAVKSIQHRALAALRSALAGAPDLADEAASQ